MKKLLCMLLILTMILMGTLAVCSCEEKSDDTNEASKSKSHKGEAVIPEGYIAYKNDDLSFAYPSDWTKNDGSVTMLMNSTGAGNNITVVYEAKTDLYEKSTEEELKAIFAQAMNAYGFSVSDFKLSQTKNDFVDKITKMTCTTTSTNTTTMRQTMFVVTVGNRTYTITVTESTADQELVDTVFNTLETFG